MSSNDTHYCYFCENNYNKLKTYCYGKISEGLFKDLEQVSEVTHFLEVLRVIKEELFGDEKIDEIMPINGNTERLDGCEFNFCFVEDWGDGISINEKGNLKLSVSGSCDLCGTEIEYDAEVIV